MLHFSFLLNPTVLYFAVNIYINSLIRSLPHICNSGFATIYFILFYKRLTLAEICIKIICIANDFRLQYYFRFMKGNVSNL